MLIPVILSGGTGTRLWPISRESHPKPFMLLPDGESLLHKTYLRARTFAAAKDIVTVTNREYFFSSKDTFQTALGSPDSSTFLLEREGRNTAAAITLATLLVQKKHGPQATILVLPADHLIGDLEAFSVAVKAAQALANMGRIVTFGIKPTHAEVGFGYIETAQPLDRGFAIERFVEKPDLPTAETYLASGKHLWNSGMFCFQAEALVQEMQAHAPEILKTCQACLDSMAMDERLGLEIPDGAYQKVPEISFDHALMEHTQLGAVVPADIGWSDIGSWSAVSELLAADPNGNRGTGETLFVDSHNTYVHGSDRLVATVGTDNLIIVDTPDALLVTTKDKGQAVREVVRRLKAQSHPAYKLHQTVARPWGTYTVLGEGPQYKLKRIVVKPGASLSLQMHHHRNEHWIVVNGEAEVTNADRVFTLQANESTYIPATHKHRLKNPGKVDLVMIEVQSGAYLGEDDIVRFEDIYGRTQNQ